MITDLDLEFPQQSAEVTASQQIPYDSDLWEGFDNLIDAVLSILQSEDLPAVLMHRFF